MNLCDIADKIGLPVEQWKGQCYGVACSLLEHGFYEGRAVYGHYTGPINPKSMFFGKPIVHHGWIETPDGKIVDPTRWVFDAAEPYIFEGSSKIDKKFYDEGGNQLLQKMEKPIPERKPDDKMKDIPVELQPMFSSLLRRNKVETQITVMEAHWIATLSLLVLKEKAKPVYEFMVANNFAAFIPLDNRRKILGQ